MRRWEKDEEERRIKAEGKREKTALTMWRKCLMGLRIIERVKEDYGDDADAQSAEKINPFTNPNKAKKVSQADPGMGSAPNRDTFSHVDDREDTGGGFFTDDDDDDDLNGGGFSLERHEEVKVPLRADQLTIEDDGALIDGDPLKGSPSTILDLGIYGPPDTDDIEGGLKNANLEGKVTLPKKASIDGRKAATVISGSSGDASTNMPKRRVAPKRKAARKSETALTTHFLEKESDENDNSDRARLTSFEFAGNKPVKRNGKQNGSGRSLRARKSTIG